MGDLHLEVEITVNNRKLPVDKLASNWGTASGIQAPRQQGINFCIKSARPIMFRLDHV
jgi:hypothetical protein